MAGRKATGGTSGKGGRPHIEGLTRPLYVTPEPSPNRGDPNYVKGAWYDQAAVDHVTARLADLRHTKTKRWYGKPLVPEPFQVEFIIAPVYGWKHPDGTRIIREVWVEVPKKNGKSTLASGLGLYHLAADGELGGEVYAAAGGKDQARIVFDAAKQMGMASPKLQPPRVEYLTSLIRYKPTGGLFRVLSRAADLAHGPNVSAGIIDEIHVHKNRGLVDAIRAGVAARDEPLVFFITTSDEGDEGSIYNELHEYTIAVADLHFDDPQFYGVIWAAEEDDDPFVEETWKKANPGYGVTVSPDYLKSKAQYAARTPSALPTFLRLHLNRRVTSEAKFIGIDDWDATASMVERSELKGEIAYGGLDLAATRDLTAFKLVFPFEDDDGPGIDVLSWFWLPEYGLKERVKQDRVPYDQWAKAGFIELTPGAVTDYRIVQERIEEAAKLYQIMRVSYDRKFAGPLIQNLEELFETAPIYQLSGLSAATKELERLVLGSKIPIPPEEREDPKNDDEYRLSPRIRHGGHPVLRWNVDVMNVKRDEFDNIRPVKPDRAKSTKRIDGAVALIHAIDGWIRYRDEETGEVVSY